MRRFAWERGGAIVLLATAVYAFLAPTAIVSNDNAEFSTLGAIGGIAHAPGYPGYVLFLRALAWLPSASPAHAAALATVVLAALQLAALHAACRAWGARPLAASLVVALYAAAPTVLRYATEAEAFTPNQLVVTLVLWLSVPSGPLRGVWRAGALGLVAGLGLTNHLTCVLVAPVGVIGIVHAWREAGPKVIATSVGGLVIGLLPYVYLFTAPENLLAWPPAHSLDDALAIVTRRAYGGALAFNGVEGSVPYAAQLWELAISLARGMWYAGLPIAAVALGIRIARPEKGMRGAWIALACSFLLAGPVLVCKFNIPIDEIGRYVVHRFHLLPLLLLAIPLAIGIDMIASRIPKPQKALSPRLANALPFALFGVALASSLPVVGRVHSRAMEAEVRNMLDALPEHAVVMSGIVDEIDVGMRYLQLACGERPDVLEFRTQAARIEWYRARLIAYGVPEGPYDPRTTVAHFQATGRRVFVQWADTDLRHAFPSVPYGTLVELLPPGSQIPTPLALFEQAQAMLAKFDLDYPRPGPEDEFATWVQRKYVTWWTRLAAVLTAAGRGGEAAAAQELAASLAPQ